ncbi:MAG: lamin tail domain-containing protein, partial [Actinomycetota bacterium]|nr:lamin tail domain-containing protein [Actinomycetota bacterium]
MPPLRTLASGRNGAIGCDYSPSANAVYFVDFNRGEIVRIDLAAGTAQAIGSGYAFPEDIAIGPDGRAYVTERTGALLRVDLANAARSAATVLHSGMTAPQQIALSADGRRVYTVEYTQATSGGSLWRVDLSGATPVAQALVSGLREAVGVLVSADEQFALVNEQLGAGTVTRLTLASGARQQLVANVPAPFFMRWIDARRTELFLPLRDPHNRIVRISLAPRAPAVANVLNVPFRPSSVVVTPRARIVVCCDAVVEEHQLATDSAARILGIVYDPPGPDLKAERIVLQNRGANYVDLTGWTIRDAANHVYSFAAGLHVPPGDVLRLWTKTGTDGDGDVYWNRGMPVWNNTPGDVARLRDGQGADVDTHTYSTPSVKTTPGAGTTLGPGGGGAMYSPLVSPHDASLLYACCDMGGLYRSTNGGGAWRLVDGREIFVNITIDRAAPPRLLPPRPLACHPDPAKSDWLVAWSELRGLRLSRDRGATWSDVPTGTAWRVTALAIDPANGRLFAGTQNGAHFHDPDATGAWTGTGWTACAAQSGGPLTGAVVAFVLLPGGGSASHMLATRGDATQDGEVMRSVDGGSTWANASAGLPPTSGGRRRINDFAGGFNASLHPTAVVYATVPSDPAGTTGGVYGLDTAVGTWTRLVSGQLPATAGSGAVQYECLGVSPNNPNLVYVTGFAANAGWREFAGIFRSPDRGSTWQSVWTGATVTGGWLEFERPGFGGPPLGLSVRQHVPGSGPATA